VCVHTNTHTHIMYNVETLVWKRNKNLGEHRMQRAIGSPALSYTFNRLWRVAKLRYTLHIRGEIRSSCTC